MREPSLQPGSVHPSLTSSTASLSVTTPSPTPQDGDAPPGSAPALAPVLRRDSRDLDREEEAYFAAEDDDGDDRESPPAAAPARAAAPDDGPAAGAAPPAVAPPDVARGGGAAGDAGRANGALLGLAGYADDDDDAVDVSKEGSAGWAAANSTCDENGAPDCLPADAKRTLEAGGEDAALLKSPKLGRECSPHSAAK